MSKTRRISGPSAYAMRELVARLRVLMLELLRAETAADAKLHIRRADESLRHWAAVHLPVYTHKEMRAVDGKSATDKPPTVEAPAVAEDATATDEVDRGKQSRCC